MPMYFDTKNVVISILLMAAVAATWYFGRIGTTATGPTEATVSPPLGYYLKGATLLGTNDQGRVFFRLEAESVTEDGERAALDLDSVRVEYHDNEDVSWQVSAARASAAQDQGYLELSGDVRLTNRVDAGTPATLIETEHLLLDPEAYLASTGEQVAVSIGDHRLAATGMKAYLKDDRLELESRVHGQFRN
jgi:lipopolysaccharide export system protein LptC